MDPLLSVRSGFRAESAAPPAPATDASAPFLEAFASIQGEGLYVGWPQVFLRLAGCPLRCRWCDTPASWSLPAEPRTRVDAAGGRRVEAGRATPLRAAAWVAELDPSGRRAVSLTGGEPLTRPDFVRALAPLLGRRRLHLETAAAHPRALEAVLDVVDHVSLDLKLSQDLAAPVELADALHAREPSPQSAREWEEVRARVLRLVRGRDAAAKIVVAGDRAPALFEPLLGDVADLAPELPVFFQPVTPVNGVSAPDRSTLEDLVERALERGLDARVVPQVHRTLRLP